MKKITKKAFKYLHMNKKILLVCSVMKTKEEVKERVISFKEKLSGNEVTGLTINNHGDYEKIACYEEVLNNQVFYFVEFVIDNSKNKNCSWDTLEYQTILYVKKD